VMLWSPLVLEKRRARLLQGFMVKSEISRRRALTSGPATILQEEAMSRNFWVHVMESRRVKTLGTMALLGAYEVHAMPMLLVLALAA